MSGKLNDALAAVCPKCVVSVIVSFAYGSHNQYWVTRAIGEEHTHVGVGHTKNDSEMSMLGYAAMFVQERKG